MPVRKTLLLKNNNNNNNNNGVPSPQDSFCPGEVVGR